MGRGILDEFGNCKPNAWGANVRPALSDRNGWCDLIGVPEGRNHYYDNNKRSRRWRSLARRASGHTFHGPSEVLPLYGARRKSQQRCATWTS
jgi:hypothetical protein